MGLQGNHSDLLVQLSHIHSILRGDTTGVKNEDSSQGFVRSTTKYWVCPCACLSTCASLICVVCPLLDSS